MRRRSFSSNDKNGNGVENMTSEQLRAVLMGAFDRSSHSDQVYLAGTALTLAVAAPAELPATEEQRYSGLRLVGSSLTR
jgi:hypothetical protein